MLPIPARTLLCVLALSACASRADASGVARIRLQSQDATVEVTPALGGRLLHFAADGLPNLIKTGAPVHSQPAPRVAADADDIGYLGHDVWLGPQSAWWADQEVNAQRRDARANWPPDPFLSFASTTVSAQSPTRVVLEGIDSPVTGVRLRKTFAFLPEDPAVLEVHASARNIRDRPIARDLWFNTRVSAATRVYVPVTDARSVRVDDAAGAGIAPLVWRIEEGVFSFTPSALPTGTTVRRGKVFLQPSAGWMAGFAQGQAFILRFDHQPRERIHPEQGQVELYLDHDADVADGLLEMELHAPYRTLAPGASMEASQHWSALRYDGPDTAASHRAFLCQVAARRLRAPELCVAAPASP